MLIVIEGADGVGKDTVADAVARAIGAARLNTPNNNNVTGPWLRSWLKKDWQTMVKRADDQRFQPQLNTMAFQALMLANLTESIDVLYKASLATADGPSLVMARFWQSAVVYGALDGVSTEWLKDINKVFHDLPHVNILLQAPAQTCMDRRALRDGPVAIERYEGKLDITERVVKAYDTLWAKEAEASGIGGGWEVVDATKSMGTVIADTIQTVFRYT